MQERVLGLSESADVAVPEGKPALRPRVSWGAVFAGSVVAVTVGAMLNVLGVAVGATTMDPATAGGTPGAETFAIASSIWLLAANLIGLVVGGYVAARLCGATDRTDGALHGVSVWAIAYLLSAVLLGNVIAGTVATATRGITNLLGGLAQGTGQVVSTVAQQSGLEPQALVERAQEALRGGGDPTQMTSEQRNAEIARLLARAATSNEPLPQPQRDRLTQFVAVEYNLSPQEAQQRLEQAEQQVAQAARDAERQARQAAEAAADAAAVAAYWIFAVMLLGAIAAVLGAWVGTRNAVRLTSANRAPSPGAGLTPPP